LPTVQYIDITNGGSNDGMIAASGRVLALTTVRDRVAKLAGDGRTLERTVAAKPTADLDAEWTKATGVPPDLFVALVYESLPRR